MARELTDPGRLLPPTELDIERALEEAAEDRPDAAAVLRHALVARAAERLSVDLIREAIRQQERTEQAMRAMAPAHERAVAALEVDVETRRRAQALTERQEASALEHVRGAWGAIKTAAGNRAVIGLAASAVTWLLSWLFGGQSAWWQP